MLKTIFKICGSLVFVAIVTGCATPSMIDSKDRMPLGFAVEVEHKDRITDKVVNIQFKKNSESFDDRFYWDKYVAETISLLEKKGVVISEAGTPVTVTIEKFEVLGSSNGAYRGSNTASAVALEHGGIGANIIASIGQSIFNSTRKNKERKDDGRNFLPIVDITVVKDDGSYSNKILLTSHMARGDYLKAPKDAASMAVSELFQ